MVMVNENDILKKAILLAIKAHRDQERLDGTPYILHPLAIMDQMQTPREKTVAVLHDVIEDHPEYFEEVFHLLGHDQELMNAIARLTRNQDAKLNRTYEDYIDYMILREDQIAIKVKIADIKHNLSTIEIFGDKAPQMKERYEKALTKLECYLNK